MDRAALATEGLQLRPPREQQCPEYELYDYVADPLETKNLAATQPDVVTQLRRLLAAQPEAKPPVSAPAGGAATGKTSTVGAKKKKNLPRAKGA